MVGTTTAGHNVISAARFVVSVTGAGSDTTNIAFTELAGINSEVEPVEYVSTSRSGVTMAKQYGKTKPCTVTLKRGVDSDATMWTWHQAVMQGSPMGRRSCSLLLQDASGATKAKYTLVNAWPSKLSVGNLKAGSTDFVLMEVTLICDEVLFTPGSS